MADITLENGTVTSSGTGSLMTPSNNTLVGMFINISAVSGTLPSLVVQLQHSPQGTDWYNVPNMVSSSIASTGLIAVYATAGQKVCDNLRCVWTVGGVSPSYTFDVELVTEN